ncbi:MAG: hypothetical protein F6K10_07395 [Moorea sp. SIO2B7]|nr:hypothetical protein [Moorena sp. SIO2B7]
MAIKIQYWLLGLMVVGTATVTTHFFHIGMACLVTFFLAYVSKGSRSHPPIKKISKNKNDPYF